MPEHPEHALKTLGSGSSDDTIVAEKDISEKSSETRPGLSQPENQTQGLGTEKDGGGGEGKEKDNAKIPYHNISGGRFKLLFACILMSYAIAYFDSTFMASSHPVITSYFKASNAAAWLSTTFYLSNTISQPLYGRLSDTFGRRTVFLLALAIFGGATAWCAFAKSIFSLIAARTVCGLGAGGMLAMSEVLMANVIKIEYRGMYQSYLNIAYGAGSGLGGALGGILCDKLGWRAAFWLQLPFIGIAMVLAFVSVPRNLGPCLAQQERLAVFRAFKTFDCVGALILTITVSGLILGINLGGSVFPWTHPAVLASLAVFVVTTPMFIWWEKRTDIAVLPPGLLANKPWANHMWSNFCGGLIYSTVIFNVPLFLQSARQASPTVSGLYMLSPLVCITAAAVITGILIKETGRLKALLTTGAVFMTVGVMTCTSLTIPGLPTWPMLFLIPWTSVGQGFLFPTTTVAVLRLCITDDQAIVTTTLGLSRTLGSMMGVAVSSLAEQNFLVYYLSKMVTGEPDTKDKIISQVRKSVLSIPSLQEPYKSEVIEAYTLALRYTFAITGIFGLVICCLIFPLKVPRLKQAKRSSEDKEGQDRKESSGSGESGSTDSN